MEIRVREIGEVAKDLTYEEPIAELNHLFEQPSPHDYEFNESATVQVQYYRAAEELFFDGHASGRATGYCARCLEPFELRLDVPFSFVLVRRPLGSAAVELEVEDQDLSYYDGDHVDLSPLVHERIILSLPLRPLCRQGCRGLCSQCGANLNTGACKCRPETGDPRLAVFRTLKVDR